MSFSADDSRNISAPKLHNDRHRIYWNEDGIMKYQVLVAPQLERLQDLWLSGIQSPSRNCISLLLNATNDVLTVCAQETNEFQSLGHKVPKRSVHTPKPI